MKLGLIILFLSALFSLRCVQVSDENKSNEKFLALKQDFRFGVNYSSDFLLIHNVHSSIKYAVRYFQNKIEDKNFVEFCPDVDHSQMVATSGKSIALWLEALNDSIIKDKISTELDENGKEKAITTKAEFVDEADKANIVFNMSCDRSVIKAPEAITGTNYFSSPIQINIYPDYIGSYKALIISKNIIKDPNFFLYESIIIHEVGHAFGLADVYEYSDISFENSTLSPVNINQIKFSIMKNPSEVIKITQEDKNAIAWLYRHFVLGSSSLTDCGSDYIHDVTSNGCIPVISDKTTFLSEICQDAGGVIQQNQCICEMDHKVFDPFKDHLICKFRKISFGSESPFFCSIAGRVFPVNSVVYEPITNLVKYEFQKKNSFLSGISNNHINALIAKNIGNNGGNIDNDAFNEIVNYINSTKKMRDICS